MVQKVMNRVSRAGDTSALRKQILVDILGNHVDEYESFNRETADKKRQHRTRVPLWKFLLHLLHRDKDGVLIEWNTDHLLEFRIKDPGAMAVLWGSVKNKSDMTYEKFGRAMRYYYGKCIIEKVNGRRYSYRFVLSNRTRRYISSHFEFSLPAENEAEDVSIDSCEEEDDLDEDMCKERGRKNAVNSVPTVLELAEKGSVADCDTVPSKEKAEDVGVKLVSSLPCPTLRKISGSVDLVNQSESSKRAINEDADRDSATADKCRCEFPAKTTITRIFKPEELLSRGINFNFNDNFLPRAQKRSFSDEFLPPVEKRLGSRDAIFPPPVERGNLSGDILDPPEYFDDDDFSPSQKKIKFCDRFVFPHRERVTFYNSYNLNSEENPNICDYDVDPPGQERHKFLQSPVRGSAFSVPERTVRILRGFTDSSPRSVPALIHVPRNAYLKSAEVHLECEQGDTSGSACFRHFRSSTSSLSDNGSDGSDSVSSLDHGRSPTVASPGLMRYSSHYHSGHTNVAPERIGAADSHNLENVAFGRPRHPQTRDVQECLRYRLKSDKRSDPFMGTSLNSDLLSYPRFDSDNFIRTGTLYAA